MADWKSDTELFALIEHELFVSVVGDVMDKLRLFHQFLPPQIRPLDPGMVLVGRAMPVLGGDTFDESGFGSNNSLMQQPFGLMFQALDDLKPGEIYVCTGSSPRHACWGAIMTTRAKRLGARGVVANGYTRDTKAVLGMSFPVFGFGPYGQDSEPRYKVYDYRTAIEIDGVRIRPGDIVFGDVDGVCIVPAEAEEEIFHNALEKVRREGLVNQALESGETAVAAFRRYGVF